MEHRIIWLRDLVIYKMGAKVGYLKSFEIWCWREWRR
jgi:hypothetical protein